VFLLKRHFFEANRAHVVVVAVVDISFILAFQAHFELFQSLIWGYVSGFVLVASKLIENLHLPSYLEISTEVTEPGLYLFVSCERTKPDIFKRLLEA
jgi:hypothetical protein